jgi:hypothetical protein
METDQKECFHSSCFSTVPQQYLMNITPPHHGHGRLDNMSQRSAVGGVAMRALYHFSHMAHASVVIGHVLLAPAHYRRWW